MRYLQFIQENRRWLAGGFLLNYFSSFGQTFFIGISAGEIRTAFDLSHGAWGSLYMFATLASALSLPWIGAIVDRVAAWKVIVFTATVLGAACGLFALAPNVLVLAVAIYGLRLFGQGMMTHIALTCMGKWYAAQRGKAVSLTSIGVNLGEASLPILFVMLLAAYGWRISWLIAAASLFVVALPVISVLMSVERQPRSSDPVSRSHIIRHWTRGEVFRDPLFYMMLIGVLAPPFIGTTIVFHQVYLVELRGWSMQLFAAAFPVMSIMVVSCAVLAGILIDRFGALRLLPVFLLPLAAACFTLGVIHEAWAIFLFMALLGIAYGFSTILIGSVWAELYGTAHLGSVRAAIVSVMVFSTAAGPGVTGYLIDLGIDYSLQITFMGIYCLAAVGLMFFASRIALARELSEKAA